MRIPTFALLIVLIILPSTAHPEERLFPANLSAVQKKNLEKFLASVEKPRSFLPDRARYVGNAPEGLEVKDDAATEFKQYLAAIVPHTTTDATKSPAKVDVYWYRPNPRIGSPGVTVRRTLDLAKGEPVGDPEVLFNHATPLAREEREGAVALARKQIPTVADFYKDVEEKDIEVVALVQVISASGQQDGEPGDRLVNLQLLKKNTRQRASVMVNLTRQKGRDLNAP